jgi:hypothetical protein
VESPTRLGQPDESNAVFSGVGESSYTMASGGHGARWGPPRRVPRLLGPEPAANGLADVTVLPTCSSQADPPRLARLMRRQRKMEGDVPSFDCEM